MALRRAWSICASAVVIKVAVADGDGQGVDVGFLRKRATSAGSVPWLGRSG